MKIMIPQESIPPPKAFIKKIQVGSSKVETADIDVTNNTYLKKK
jgi:hypothetical protein